MRIRPNIFDEVTSIIAKWPDGTMRAMVLKEMQKEIDRYNRGDFSPAEKEILNAAERLGEAAAKNHEKMILEIIGGL